MNSCFLSHSALIIKPDKQPTTPEPIKFKPTSLFASKMMFKSTTVAALLFGVAIASPIAPRGEAITQTAEATKATGSAEAYDWAEGWKKTFPIHQSCNSTLHRQLTNGLDEAVQLAQHAKDHILRFGHKSEFVQKYFGNASTSQPIGWYERIINADKTGMLFRCDDPDRNCVTQDSKSSCSLVQEHS